MRKPRDWRVAPIDTLDLRPVPGLVRSRARREDTSRQQFTARDVIARWNVVEVCSRATARAAAAFPETLQHRLPFPVRTLQVDGGSEFAAALEQTCRQQGLHLFALPPRSPKLHGAVERAHYTHREEFYEVTPCSLQIAHLNQELRNWERIYNIVRPHQALGYRTPQGFLAQWQSQPNQPRCH